LAQKKKETHIQVIVRVLRGDMAPKIGGVGQRKGDMAPRCLWVTLTASDSDPSVELCSHDRMGLYEPLLNVRAKVIGTKKKSYPASLI
jgi:hypothetical protein